MASPTSSDEDVSILEQCGQIGFLVLEGFLADERTMAASQPTT